MWTSCPPPAAAGSAHSLTYSLPQYLAGLGETITEVKTPSSTYAIRANGDVQDLSELRNADRRARVAKYGALSPEAATHLDRQSVDGRFDIAIYFRTSEHLGEDTATSASLDARRTSSKAKGVALTRKLQELGMNVEPNVGLLPALWTSATVAQIKVIARMPEVVLVQLRLKGDRMLGEGQYANPNPSNAVTVPGIDNAFNAGGNYAQGQKIGFIEGAWCTAQDAHEAFTFTNAGAGTGFVSGGIEYHSFPLACETDDDCKEYCTSGGRWNIPGDAHCDYIGSDWGVKRCYSAHLTGTMSVASASSTSTRHGAAEAKYYVANQDYGGDGVGCNGPAMAYAYDWLTSTGTRLVNESFYCPPADSSNPFYSNDDGIAADYFSRVAGTITFRAAGNNPNLDFKACPWSLNSVCVGSMNLAGNLSCSSSWANFASPATEVDDREEPDLVAFGGGADGPPCSFVPEVDVAAPVTGLQEWQKQSGTSNAAPAVAAMAALLATECNIGTYNPLELRAWLKTTAHVHNPGGGRALFHPTERVGCRFPRRRGRVRRGNTQEVVRAGNRRRSCRLRLRSTTRCRRYTASRLAAASSGKCEYASCVASALEHSSSEFVAHRGTARPTVAQAWGARA